MPTTWLYPRATRRAFRLSRVPSELYLFLNIHLQPMTCALGGSSTRVHVLFFRSASYYVCMTFFHSICLRASLAITGTTSVAIAENTLGLVIPDFPQVCIGCILVVTGCR